MRSPRFRANGDTRVPDETYQQTLRTGEENHSNSVLPDGNPSGEGITTHTSLTAANGAPFCRD